MKIGGCNSLSQTQYHFIVLNISYALHSDYFIGRNYMVIARLGQSMVINLKNYTQ